MPSSSCHWSHSPPSRTCQPLSDALSRKQGGMFGTKCPPGPSGLYRVLDLNTLDSRWTGPRAGKDTGTEKLHRVWKIEMKATSYNSRINSVLEILKLSSKVVKLFQAQMKGNPHLGMKSRSLCFVIWLDVHWWNFKEVSFLKVYLISFFKVHMILHVRIL